MILPVPSGATVLLAGAASIEFAEAWFRGSMALVLLVSGQ